MSYSRLAVLPALVGLLLIAGCGPIVTINPQYPSTEPRTEESVDAPTLEPAPTPTPDASRISGSVDVVERDGYSLRITYELELGEPSTSIVNDKPGEGTVSIPISSSVVITNTTPGREYQVKPGSLINFTVDLVYAWQGTSTDRPICGSNLPTGSPGPDGLVSCVWTVGGDNLLILNAPIPSGASSRNLGANLSTEFQISGVPEALLPGVLSQIGQPDYVIITGQKGWVETRCHRSTWPILASYPAIAGCTD